MGLDPMPETPSSARGLWWSQGQSEVPSAVALFKSSKVGLGFGYRSATTEVLLLTNAPWGMRSQLSATLSRAGSSTACYDLSSARPRTFCAIFLLTPPVRVISIVLPNDHPMMLLTDYLLFPPPGKPRSPGHYLGSSVPSPLRGALHHGLHRYLIIGGKPPILKDLTPVS